MRLVACLLIAALALGAVLLLNGGPLYYFDTAGYLIQGRAALEALGLLPALPPAETAAETPVGVTGSRAMSYGLLLAGSAALLGLSLAALPQMLAALGAVALTARALGGGPVLWAAALGIAALSALPFYAAYLMPDLFAGILILIAALLSARAPGLSRPQLIAALALGAFAVTTHLSHLGIALLLIPASLVLRLLIARRDWWQAPLLLALIAGAGLAERAAFSLVVARQAGAEVIYQPFLTARMIADGPGMAYLAGACPGRDPACPLYEILAAPGDPARLDPTQILFETSPALGSFRLLPLETQATIARDQRRFLTRVALHDPLGTARGILANTSQQMRHVSISQTLPSESTIAYMRRALGGLPEGLATTRLTAKPPWLAGLDTGHRILYGVSFLALLAGVLHPRTGPPLRIFVAMILIGILTNALICGGISQPAPRYGARVAWLLPVAAVLVLGRITRWPARAGALPP